MAKLYIKNYDNMKGWGDVLYISVHLRVDMNFTSKYDIIFHKIDKLMNEKKIKEKTYYNNQIIIVFSGVHFAMQQKRLEAGVMHPKSV